MSRIIWIPLSLILFVLACKSQREPIAPENYPDNIGDSMFDAAVDTADFSPCSTAYIGQYYEFSNGPMFENEKPALAQYFANLPTDPAHFNGYMVIRFIVNCKGQTGRFRLQTLDLDMKELAIKSDLPAQLVTIIKNMKGWGVPSRGDTAFDYYQYLTFKIVHGEVKEILP